MQPKIRSFRVGKLLPHYKYNVPVNNTTLYFIYNKNKKVIYCQDDMFRPLLGHLQDLWENRP